MFCASLIYTEGDGKIAAGANAKQEKSFTHQTCRHILVQKQSEALRISQEIHDGKISFNEAAFQFSEDKAGAHGLLGDKAQNEVRPVLPLLVITTTYATHTHTRGLAHPCVRARAHVLRRQLDPDFWAAALTCKEGDWLREPVKTQWGWHLIMVQGRVTKKAGGAGKKK